MNTEQEITEIADEIERKENRRKARLELNRRRSQQAATERIEHSKRRDREAIAKMQDEQRQELVDAFGKIGERIPPATTFQYLELTRPGTSGNRGAVLVGRPGEDPYARQHRLERTLADAQRAGFNATRGRSQLGTRLLTKRLDRVVALNPDLDELRRLSGQRR